MLEFWKLTTGKQYKLIYLLSRFSAEKPVIFYCGEFVGLIAALIIHIFMMSCVEVKYSTIKFPANGNIYSMTTFCVYHQFQTRVRNTLQFSNQTLKISVIFNSIFIVIFMPADKVVHYIPTVQKLLFLEYWKSSYLNRSET